MQWLAELQWWIPAGLVIAGLAVLVTGINRLERKLRYMGLGAVALGVGIGLASYFMESDKEICERRTREMMAALEERDWPTLRACMHPDVSIVNWEGRDTLLEGARRYAERYELKRTRVLRTEPMDMSPRILVRMTASSDFRDGAEIVTNWKLYWVREGKSWLLDEIEPEGGPYLPPSLVEQYFRSPPR